MPRLRLPIVVAVLVTSALAGLTGCGLFGGDDDPGAPPSAAVDPAAVLADAKAALDGAPSLAFTLEGTDLPAEGTALVGAEGDLARPDGFAGSLEVRLAGSLAKVEVISVGGAFYAKLPFTTQFAKVDPGTLGFTDPGSFIDPDTGISQLLTRATDPEAGRQARIAAELVQEVTATLPGQVVDDLLVSADPAQDVEATFAVVSGGPDDGQLRRAVLTGPFFAAGTDSTFTILLTDYGKRVQVTAPAP